MLTFMLHEVWFSIESFLTDFTNVIICAFMNFDVSLQVWFFAELFAAIVWTDEGFFTVVALKMCDEPGFPLQDFATVQISTWEGFFLRFASASWCCFIRLSSFKTLFGLDLLCLCRDVHTWLGLLQPFFSKFLYFWVWDSPSPSSSLIRCSLYTSSFHQN